MNVKVMVCCHKKDVMISEYPYYPIHVGKERSFLDIGIPGDNTGDNISEKNDCYCELTGMYWAWKNLKGVDIIGLCHYRRYFDFHNQCKSYLPFTTFSTESISQLDFTIPAKYIKFVAEGKIVVAKEKIYRFPLYIDFCIQHYSDDFRIMTYVIKKSQPENIKKAFYDIMIKGNKLSMCNMFLMNWNDFESYCNWIFNLLEEIESLSNISNYNPRQKRIYGFMSERLLNVWLVANKKNLIHKPILVLDDNSSTRIVECLSNIPKYFISRLNRRNISYKEWLNADIDPYYNILL